MLFNELLEREPCKIVLIHHGDEKEQEAEKAMDGGSSFIFFSF